MRLFDDDPDLVVDLARDLVRVVRLVTQLAPEEGHVGRVTQHTRAELLAHAVAHHHLLGGRSDLLEIVGVAGGDLFEDELLGGATTKRHRELIHQRGARGQVAILARKRDRVAERLTAADDRDLVDLVGVLEEVADDRVTHLVMGGDLAFLLREQSRSLLGAGDHAHDPLFELRLADLLATAARGEQRRFVDEVGEIGAGEAGRAGGERVEVDLRRQRLPLGVHLENLATTDAIGPVDDDLTIEAARAEQGRVEDVGPVRGRDQDDVVLQLEAVHLDQQLVQRLLALVVTAAQPGTAVPSDSVDLVHEDDAGCRLLGLLEQIAHAAGADADEHLDEVRARDREEGHTGLTGDGARKQRLTGSRRPVEQHARGDARPECLELLRVLEKLLDLLQLLNRLVHAGDVAEADFRRVRRHPLGPALAEAHHPRAAALELIHQEDPDPEEEHEGKQADENRDPGRAAGAFRAVEHVMRLKNRLVVGLGLRARVVDLAAYGLGPRGRSCGDFEHVLDLLRVGAEGDLLHLVRLGTRDQLRVGERLGLRSARLRQKRGHEKHGPDYQDQRKERAAKEPAHS